MSLRSRVLVVDDEMGVRESLRAILHGECEVVTAASGEAALEVMARESIEVMTLNLKMPGLGGIGVLERAKQIDPDLEVLIITGYGSLDTAVQGLRLRAFDYLSKPFDSAQVRRLVARAIARRAAVRRMKTLPEQLLSGLSHELRTPLNVIMGYSAILREEGEENLSEEQRVALDRIQSNSSSLLAYIETIFYMAELDRGLMPLVRGDVRVSDVLARVGAARARQGPRLAPRRARGAAAHDRRGQARAAGARARRQRGPLHRRGRGRAGGAPGGHRRHARGAGLGAGDRSRADRRDRGRDRRPRHDASPPPPRLRASPGRAPGPHPRGIAHHGGGSRRHHVPPRRPRPRGRREQPQRAGRDGLTRLDPSDTCRTGPLHARARLRRRRGRA